MSVQTSDNAWKLAERKARYGHRDQLMYRDSEGTWRNDSVTAESIKRALIAGGTKVRFFIVAADSCWRSIYRWHDGCRMIRHIKRGYY